MPQKQKTDFEKARRYVILYNKEFITTTNNKLFCKICSCVVSSLRKSSIEKHRSSRKHKNALFSSKSTQSFFASPIDESSTTIVEAFVKSNIPLNKLAHHEI
jgi:hypothetical protein